MTRGHGDTGTRGHGDTGTRKHGEKEKLKDGETASNVIPDEPRFAGRDPWFDKLTTLSKVEGVSSKLLFFLDSGYPPADSGMTDLALALKISSFSAAF